MRRKNHLHSMFCMAVIWSCRRPSMYDAMKSAVVLMSHATGCPSTVHMTSMGRCMAGTAGTLRAEIARTRLSPSSRRHLASSLAAIMMGESSLIRSTSVRYRYRRDIVCHSTGLTHCR